MNKEGHAKRGQEMNKEGYARILVYTIAIFLFMVISSFFVYGAVFYCGVMDPNNNNVCLTTGTLTITAGTTSSSCVCTWTKDCSVAGPYKSFEYSNDGTSWTSVFSADLPTPHIHYTSIYSSIITYGVTTNILGVAYHACCSSPAPTNCVDMNSSCRSGAEVCTPPGGSRYSHIDEDCNGETDYDNQPDAYRIPGLHGDRACPVGITSIQVSETYPEAYTQIDVICNSSIALVNSVAAMVVDPDGKKKDCIPGAWSGKSLAFMCDVENCTSNNPDCRGDVPKNVICYVNGSSSYQSGTNKSVQIRPNCSATLYGWVLDDKKQAVAGSLVKAYGNSSIYHNNRLFRFNDTTDSTGFYYILVNGNATYDMIASKTGYTENNTYNIYVRLNRSRETNFTIYPKVSDCESDCTKDNDATCHSECEEIAGCSFYNNAAKGLCDLKQKGWIVDYNSTHEMICCNGIPYPKSLLQVLEVEPGTENKIRQVRIVMFRGKPVKMVVDVFN